MTDLPVETSVTETELGAEISQLRAAAGMTVGQLAARTGLFAPHLLRIEQGLEPASTYALRKIADELLKAGVDPCNHCCPEVFALCPEPHTTVAGRPTEDNCSG